jgi:hypothetical protein
VRLRYVSEGRVKIAMAGTNSSERRIPLKFELDEKVKESTPPDSKSGPRASRTTARLRTPLCSLLRLSRSMLMHDSELAKWPYRAAAQKEPLSLPRTEGHRGVDHAPRDTKRQGRRRRVHTRLFSIFGAAHTMTTAARDSSPRACVEYCAGRLICRGRMRKPRAKAPDDALLSAGAPAGMVSLSPIREEEGAQQACPGGHKALDFLFVYIWKKPELYVT